MKHTQSLVVAVASAILVIVGLVTVFGAGAAWWHIAVLTVGGFTLGFSTRAILVPAAARLAQNTARPRKTDGGSHQDSRRRNRSEKRRGGSSRGGGNSQKKKAQPQSSGPRMSGSIKWFSDRKGFGFITPENGDEDCFVHRSAIQGGQSLSEGTRVEFEIVKDDRGRRAAANVTSSG